jgi:WD40 repeat protein
MMKFICLFGKANLLIFLIVTQHATIEAQDLYLSPLAKVRASSKRVTSISFSPDSRLLSVLASNDEVVVLGVADQKKLRGFVSKSQIILHAFSENDILIILDKSGKLIRHSVTSNDESPFSLSPNIKSACLDPANQYVASFNKENMIELLDLKTGMSAGRIPVAGSIKEVGYLGYDRFSKQISLVSSTGEAYSWNPLNQKFLRELRLRSSEYANSSSVIHAAGSNSGADRFLLGLEEVFIPQGGFMNTSNRLERRNWLLSYDWETGQELKKISTKYLVDGMATGPGPNHVAYFSAKSQAIILLNLDKVEATSVVSVDEEPSSISMSPDNEILAVGTVAGNVYLFEVVRNAPTAIRVTKPTLDRSYGSQTVKELTMNVEGVIDGKEKISKIFVNSKQVQPGIGNSFSTTVDLVKGKNKIRVAVQNSESIITERDFYVTCLPDTASKAKPASSPGKRMALVVGNSNYVVGNKLINTINDSKMVAETLKNLNFEVTTIFDGDYEKMKNAVYAFGDQIGDVDISLFYYAGHGVEVDGTNYLIPVDANIESALDVKQKALPLSGILRTMEFANDEGLNMIILDACRNNPFPTGKRGGAGLGRIQAPSGTIIAYATDPGSTASDGDGKNGLYTGVLVDQLNVSQRIEDIFMNTRNQVERISQGKQRPWEEARLKGVFYLK